MRLTFDLIATSIVCGPLAAQQTLPAPVAQQVDVVFAKL